MRLKQSTDLIKKFVLVIDKTVGIDFPLFSLETIRSKGIKNNELEHDLQILTSIYLLEAPIWRQWTTLRNPKKESNLLEILWYFYLQN